MENEGQLIKAFHVNDGQQDKKIQVRLSSFLGRGRRVTESGSVPTYYNKLLTWALHQHIERAGWKIIDTLACNWRIPHYDKVDTGNTKVDLVTDGHLLIEKDEHRLIVTIDGESLLLEGLVQKKDEITGFLSSVLKIVADENFYRGGNIEFLGDEIRFLDLNGRSWDSVVLDDETKAEIRDNSIEFLRRRSEWEKFGIPRKRGIILAGEAGTGKTVICKALMAEAKGISCISVNSYALCKGELFINLLFDLAADLSPSIVLIEDIDIIGRNRIEFGYQGGPVTLSLLNELDGIEEQTDIVTIATTNYLETLDKTLSERPSRFDRVIVLGRHTIEQRRDHIRYLCQKIPLEVSTQDYIAQKADNCTPAQLQEVIFSLIIHGLGESTIDNEGIDRVISRVNRRKGHSLGFNHGGCNETKIGRTEVRN